MSSPLKDAEDGEPLALLLKDAMAASRSRSVSDGARGDAVVAPAPRASEKTVMVSSTRASLPARLDDVPLSSDGGRPPNFGVIVPGVYRSGYPMPADFAYLQTLGLKTIVTLVQKDEKNHHLERFTTANGIRQIVFDMKGTKKESIPLSTMASILSVVLDRQHYPLLVHCNHGKHRTGCVAAVIRKLSGWHLDSALAEYRAYAAPKTRDCDIDYISAFQPSSLQPTAFDPRRGASLFQTRKILRNIVFAALVLVVWLVSATHLPSASSVG